MPRRSLFEIGRQEDGAVVLVLAFLLLPLLAFVGLATDAARGYLLQSRLSQALDAAALAGGRVMFDDDRDADINKFFRANFPEGFLGSRVSGPNIEVDAEGENITLTATATIDTTFMRLFQQDTLTVASRAVVQRAVRGMELVLVMDNTGSMLSGGKIDAMKAGAADLVNILFGGRNEVPNFWISLVPYTATVNIGPAQTGWLAAGALAGHDYSVTPQGWKGCVEARYGDGNDMTDALPSISALQPFYYPAASDNAYPPVDESVATNTTGNTGTGPNLGCGPAITPMATKRDAILPAIAEMLPWHRGGTMSNLGLAWGWRLLSPQWRAMWSAATPQLPLDYGTPYMDKVVVLLTDGENQFYDHPPSGPGSSDYTAYGRLADGNAGVTNRALATKELDDRTAVLCDSMKQQGITLFTITFQLHNADTQALFRGCASKPEYYFDSPSNDDLRRAFRTIGATLSNLRLAR